MLGVWLASDMPFAHERLDVYSLALDFIALADYVVDRRTGARWVADMVLEIWPPDSIGWPPAPGPGRHFEADWIGLGP